MNTGIQDGYNLAWKLALVLGGVAAGNLLNTYNEERLENAKNLLRTTDRMFQIAAGDEWWLALLRTNVLPTIAKYILNLESVRSAIFPTLSQTGINYRHSSLSWHAGDEDFTVKAGDRMPYVVLNGASVYDSLRGPRFHLVTFSADEIRDDGMEIESRYAEFVDVNSFQINSDVTEKFGTDQSFSVFLRPDNYIGFISAKWSDDDIGNYLTKTAFCQ
jgi:hypothetical protein